jgi:hypothetical protein
MIHIRKAVRVKASGKIRRRTTRRAAFCTISNRSAVFARHSWNYVTEDTHIEFDLNSPDRVHD